MGTWGLRDIWFRGHGTEDIHTFRVRHGDIGTWGHAEDIHTFRVRHGDMGYESEISLDSSEVSQLSCLLFSTVRIRRAQAIRFRRAQATRFRRAQATPRPQLSNSNSTPFKSPSHSRHHTECKSVVESQGHISNPNNALKANSTITMPLCICIV